jgi:16S rRNA (guanine527-N7)-methyltransferase
MFHVKHFHSASDLGAYFLLSDPVLAKLTAYAELLVKWQQKINLVGPDTLNDQWHRHMADSAQLLSLIPQSTKRLVDLGSGAGFPGLVLAILGVPDVHLVESDQRKAVFLREVIRVTECPATVHVGRIEQVKGLDADVVTARALAPLVRLIPLALPHLVGSGICVFPKGKAAEDELTEAGKEWIMSARRVGSITDPHASILVLSEVKRG